MKCLLQIQIWKILQKNISSKNKNNTISFINSEYNMDPPRIFQKSIEENQTPNIRKISKKNKNNTLKLQQEIDKQKKKFEEQLREQQNKYYEQIKEKDSLIDSLSSKLISYESRDINESAQDFSTGGNSDPSSQKFNSKPNEKFIRSTEELNKVYFQEKNEKLNENYFTFIKILDEVKQEENKILENPETTVPLSQTLKPHMRSSQTTKEMIFSTEGSLNSVWTIPDSSKDQPEVNNRTGYYFYCESCTTDPEYHTEKLLRYI